MHSRFEVPMPLAEQMLEALGVDAPRDVATLGAFYRAWVSSVPFTNLEKALAARDGRASPEADGVALCERWLANGGGGTCWSQVSAFGGMCEQYGWRATASMERALWKGPQEVDFHGSVVLAGDGDERLLCDVIHPSGEPLPICAAAEGRHGPYAAGLRRDADGVFEHWFHHPARDAASYRVLSLDLGPDDVGAMVRVAEHLTGVRVDRVSWRRCPADAVVSVRSVGRLWADDPRPEPADPTALEFVRWSVDGSVETRSGAPEQLFAAAGARCPEVTAAAAARVVGAGHEGACNVDDGEQRFG
ncbi:MAG: hypothetical protein JJU45_06755 [Acidimicrobiia bacterium]|nr:hypothetical protein [Acidimicrobiia bacterium]